MVDFKTNVPPKNMFSHPITIHTTQPNPIPKEYIGGHLTLNIRVVYYLP